MTEKEFYDLLIQVIRNDKNPNKQNILDLLQRSNLAFDKTDDYTYHKWDHYKEYIYLTVSPNDLQKLIGYKDYIEKMIKQIYPVNDQYPYEFFGLQIKPGYIAPNETVSQEIHFEDIEQQILDELTSAKYVIWVAMAWFTNEKIYNALCAKKHEGVNVQVIIDDNERNNKAVFRLQDEFETYRVTIQSYYRNIMHDKFCIIDFKTVIHGTFNWTVAANYNKETISIDHNTATAYAFADEFMKLKRESMPDINAFQF